MHGAAVARVLRADHLERRALRLRLAAIALGQVDDAQAALADLLHDPHAADARARAQLAVGSIGDHAAQARVRLVGAEQNRVDQRVERLLVFAVADERARERALAAGAADALRVEAQHVRAEPQELVELEQPFQLALQDLDRGITGHELPSGTSAEEEARGSARCVRLPVRRGSNASKMIREYTVGVCTEATHASGRMRAA